LLNFLDNLKIENKSQYAIITIIMVHVKKIFKIVCIPIVAEGKKPAVAPVIVAPILLLLAFPCPEI
jgi:hypothetical protein